jgi:fructooligosaccharide transport system substrate-binding protein
MRITAMSQQRAVRSAAVIAALAMGVTVLAACSAEGGGRGEATDDCPDGTVELTVLRATDNVPSDEQLAAYTDSVDGCVTFDVTEVPFGQLADKISILAPSSNAPDILGYDSPDTSDFASQGILLELDEYLPDGWKDDVLPATLDEFTYDEQVYSMGVQQDALTLFYNKTMTDAAGISVPTALEDAWTWEEAREAFLSCQVGEPGNADVYGLAPSRIGDGTPGAMYRDLLFLRSAGDPEAPEDSSAYKTFYALSPDGTEAEGWLNTPEAVEAATFYQSLFQGPEAVTSKTGRPNAFIDGKACFDLEVNEIIQNVEDANVDFEWGIAPMPYFTTPIVHTGAITIGAGAKSKEPEAAAEAVVAMSSGALVEEYNQEAFRMPTLTSVYDALPEFHEVPYDLIRDELLEWGQPRPPTPYFSQYNQIVTDALRDIAYGGDPKSKLDAAASQLESVLPQ